MKVFISRLIELTLLAAHQVIMVFMMLSVISVIGIVMMVVYVFQEGFGGLFSSPVFLGYFYAVAAFTSFLLLLMTTELGEKFLRLFFVMRKPTMREEQKLNAALDQVQSAYRIKYNSELRVVPYVVDSPYLNGFAAGRTTIAINSGVINDAEIEEIAAVIAHEAGHLHHGDGLYNSLAFGASAHMGLTYRMCGFHAAQRGRERSGFVNLFTLPLVVIELICMPLFRLSGFITKMVNWDIEYRADDFADELGFRRGLISFFERLQALDVRDEHGFLKRVEYTHPPVMMRIDKLERKAANI